MPIQTQQKQTSFCGSCVVVGSANQQAVDALLRPLFFGRLFRVVLGIAVLGLTMYFGVDRLSAFGALALAFLGFSFLTAGVMGNPGCEITALPNLVLPEDKRVYMTCPLWTPWDRLENRLRHPESGHHSAK